MVQWMHFIVSIFLNLSISFYLFLPFDLFRYINYLIPLDRIHRVCSAVLLRCGLAFLWIYEMTLHKQSSSLLYRKMLFELKIIFLISFFKFFFFFFWFCSLYSELFLFRIVELFGSSFMCTWPGPAWADLGTWACAHGSVLTVSGGPRARQRIRFEHFGHHIRTSCILTSFKCDAVNMFEFEMHFHRNDE